MKDPAGALAARIEEFERAADPQLVLEDAALDDAEEAMRDCEGGPRDAAVWRLIGVLHLARYRLGPEGNDEAAVAGVFFAAVAVLDPEGLPARLRGPHVPAAGTADTWAGLAEQVFRHVDVNAYPHVGLLLHAILRRALAEPTADVCDRLGQALLEEALAVPQPAWAAEALAILGDGLLRLYRSSGDAGALDDAVHVLFRAALAGPGHVMNLATALGHALPGDTDLIRAYLLAVGRPPGPDRSAALLDLLDLTAARAAASCADADLLALLRVGQACLDHWHDATAHPAVLSRYGAALIEWYVVTGDTRSLEAGRDMLAALPPTPSPVPAHQETAATGEAETPSGGVRTTADRSEAATGDPGATAGHPEATAGRPGVTTGHPGAAAGRPGAMAGHPEATAGHAGVTVAHSGAAAAQAEPPGRGEPLSHAQPSGQAAPDADRAGVPSGGQAGPLAAGHGEPATPRPGEPAAPQRAEPGETGRAETVETGRAGSAETGRAVPAETGRAVPAETGRAEPGGTGRAESAETRWAESAEGKRAESQAADRGAPSAAGEPAGPWWGEPAAWLTEATAAGRTERLEDPAVRLDLLGLRHRRRHRATGDPADLEIAVQTLRQAAVRAPEGHPDRPAFLADLADALIERATRTGDPRPTPTFTRAGEAPPAAHEGAAGSGSTTRPGNTSPAGHGGAEGFAGITRPGDAPSAGLGGAEGFAGTTDRAGDAPPALHGDDAATGIHAWEPRAGDTHTAVSGARAGDAFPVTAPHAGDTHPEVGGTRLGVTGTHPEASGVQPGVSDPHFAASGIQPGGSGTHSGVSGVQPGGSGVQPGVASTRTGDAGPAITTARAAVAACPPGHPQLSRALLLLGRALLLDLTSQAADEAVAVLHEAITTDADPWIQAEAYTVLSDVLRRRDGDHLDAAVTAARHAVTLAEGAGAAVAALVKGLLARFAVRGDGQDLTEALHLAGHLAGNVPGDPELTHLLRYALGNLTFTPDDAQAEAATSLAVLAEDDETTRALLAVAERHARESAVHKEPGTPAGAEAGPHSGEAAARRGAPTGDVTGTADDLAGAKAEPSGDAADPGPGSDSGISRAGDAVGPGLGRARDVAGPGAGFEADRPDAAGPGAGSGISRAGDIASPDTGAGDVAPAGERTPGDPSRPHAGAGASRTPSHATSAEHDAADRPDAWHLAEAAVGHFLVRAAGMLAARDRRRLAIELLERAERAFTSAGERARAADASARMGREHQHLGAWEAALRMFERAADGFRAAGLVREEARQRAAMGDACAGAGEPRRAAACYQRAVELCRAAGLDAEEAACQERAAVACLDAGDQAAALERSGRARELYLRLGDQERAARALIPGARAGATLGHLPAAAELISTCASELEAIGQWDDACQALDGHALLLYELGHDDHAAACEAAIVDMVRRRGDRRDPADEWYHIGRRRFGRGDVPGARRAFERAERAYNQIGLQDGVAAVRYHLGVIGFTGAGMEQAAQDFATAAEGFGTAGRRAAALTMRAACLVELGRCNEAEDELDRAMEPAMADGDIGALFSIAVVGATADLRSGRPDGARDRLAGAFGLAAGDPVREAVVHERLAVVLAGDPGAVAEHLARAADGFRATGRAALAALASLRLGFALEEHGDLRRARKALEEGLAGAVTGWPGETPYEVIPVGGAGPGVLVRLAELRFAVGEVARGRATLAQALAAVRRGGTDRALAERLAERVRIEDAEAAGDLPGALALARQAADATDDPRRRSALLAKLCALALQAGDPETAYAFAARGCELRDGLLAEHLRGRGVAAAALGRTAEAIGHLSEAVRLARESGQAMPVRLVAALGALGAALAEERRWADAGAVLAEALALAAGPAWRGMRAPLLAARAKARFRQGDADEAMTLYGEALALAEAVGDDATVATVCGELATVHVARGEHEDARRLAERALEVDRSRGRDRAVVRDLIALGRLGDGDRLSEALSLAKRIGFAEGQAVALAELGAVDLRAGRYAGARDRASAAIDLLEAGQDPLPAGAYRPELAAAYATRAAAREELGDLAAALADAEQAGDLGDPASASVEALRSRAVGLAVRLGRAATAWTHAERARETLLGPEEDLARVIGADPGRLAGLLPDGTGVLAFHAGEVLVSVVAHRAGWARPRTFGTSVGPELLAEFAATLGAGEEGRRRAELWRVVADLLLGAAVEALGDDLDVLYLLPHGDLHGLPLHALAPGGRPLLDRYAVAYAPSAAALARLVLRRGAPGGPSLVTGQGEDADAVAAALGTRPVTASARDLEGAWDTVHLACPACYDDADPYGSGIRLPGGLLNARALAGLRMQARLVTVSGCETSRAGAGVTALGHALLRAGAAAALLPQWPVHPEVTRALLPAFYDRLAAEGPGDALRAVTLESRELYGSSRPELWAPYALTGLAA